MKRYFLSLFVCLLAVGGALPSAAQNMYSELLAEEYSPKVDSWESNGLNTTWPINNLVDGDMNTEIRGHYNRNSIITFSPSREPVVSMQCRTTTNEVKLRPTSIKVEYRHSDRDRWETAYEQDVDRNQKQWTINFRNPIPSNRYIRVTFGCGNEDQAFIYMNELTFSSTEATTRDVTIHHKPAKWYDRRDRISQDAKDMDSFSDDEPWFNLYLSSAEGQIQAAHTYIDTIYVHKGDDVHLYLPDVYRRTSTGDIETVSVSSYQRWYSYRTGRTFELRNKDEGTNARHDLLTPLDGQAVYRFANGYVGQPVSGTGNSTLSQSAYQMEFHYPSDEEFSRWIGSDSGIDNNWYVVACDVSAYTDFTPTYSDQSQRSTFFPSSNEDGKVYEPTLTHRVVFYIVGVDDRTEDKSDGWVNGFARLYDGAYRDGTGADNPASKKYLEEYDITFPARRVSNKTLDLVALTKDAGAYAIPDAENDDSYDVGYQNISVSLVPADNTAGIILEDSKFSHATLRTIRFRYPNTDNDDGTQYVNDADGDGESHATILVTKTATVDGEKTYNLARYRLTFIDEVQQLTQVQVEEIEKAAAGTQSQATDPYWNYAHRTPDYLDDNYQLLTSMTWDYDPGVGAEAAIGNKDYYPFPLGWERSSYSFYDGSQGSNFSNSNKFPEWGYYAITSTYVDFDNNWHHDTARRPQDEPSKGASRYHVYVDASDRPGIITRLPFEQDLCRGSELFVTAWVKSAVSAPAGGTQTNNEDCCMLFTIMGVRTVTSGGRTSQVYTPIYRYSTGQIHPSSFLKSTIPGCGTGKADQWFQVYFSFINDQAESNYDSYVLQVENNSYSTNGGDFYLDDVRVYMVKPRADVVQLRAGCAGERTLMSARIDWDRLSSRLGHTDDDSGVEEGIDFVFIDQTVYNEHLAAHPDDKVGALQAAAAMIGPEEASDDYDRNYGTLYFKYPFSENRLYDGTAEDPDLAKDNEQDGKFYFYRRGTAAGGNRELVVDFFSDLRANRPYWMLIRIHDDDNPTELFEELATVVDDSCAIKSTFWVTAESLIKMNGETVKPGTTYCAGQILDFSAQVRIPYISTQTGEEKYIPVTEGIYFDWYFGTEESFYEELEGGTSVQSALTHLRDLYPDATVISPETTRVVEGKLFTQADYDLLRSLSTAAPVAGSNPPLVLHRSHLNIELLETGLQLVIQPITTRTAPGSIELPEDAPQDLEKLWGQVCWEPVPMTLQADGKSPTVHAGFNLYTYPDPAFDPNLRIGLAQIESAAFEGGDHPLRIDLRGATFSTDDAPEDSRLVPLTSNEHGRNIYLIGTNDPEYEALVNDTAFSQYAYPIGYVEEFTAQHYAEGSEFDDHVSLRFYLNGEGEPRDGFVFRPKEGYWYSFSVHFEELLGGETSTACYGQFTVRMNVVPEYLVWNGGPTNNWNRDENWQRVNDAATIHAASDSFLDGNTTGRAFVPMLFSKVLIPRGKQVQLYRAGWRSDDNGHYGWESQRPAWMQAPTDSIQYDLMAYDDPDPAAEHPLVTKPYRVALCKEIHFEPGAEMLHAEYLMAERVWTDVEVPEGKWTPVSTPLQGVVAGDWYTQPGGRQQTEYFKPITFADGGYDRRNPAVYQRSWNADAATIIEDAEGGQTPVSFATVWSSAFNDASVPYTVGSGFSLKHGVGGGALFRLPKDDKSYDVATGALDRTNNGVLLSAKMVHRDPDMEKTEIEPYFTAELTPSADGRYYIVGNPFLAQMDVAAFLEDNKDVLQQKYWMETSAGDPFTAAAGSEGGWTTSDGQSAVLLPPYGAFYVEAVEGHTGPVEVKFYGEHQQLTGWTAPGTGTTTAAALTVSCASAAGTSTAAVRCIPGADDGYGAGDVQLVRGLTADASLPAVYAVAGQTAVSIDSRSRGGQVPLGVFAPEGVASTLTFTGVAALEGARLYDALTRSERPLHEGDAIAIDGPSHGRYFLRFDGAATTGLATDAAASTVNIYSAQPGEIIVAATEALTAVDVYATDGRHVRSLRPTDAPTVRIDDLPAGVYVVRAATATATADGKMRVR